MSTPPLPTRVRLKVKRIIRELSPAEREFSRIWPLIDSIPGWLSDGQEKWLFKMARSLPDGASLVEVGSFRGRSTTCLAFGCRGTAKRIFAVDTFNGNEWDFADRDFFGEFSDNLQRCGVFEYVEPVIGISEEVGKTWNKPIDFLFIDGSHRYEDVVGDFESFFPSVVPGGVVALHDVNDPKGNWPGVSKAWHENVKHQLTNLGYCSTLAFGKKPKTDSQKSQTRVRRQRKLVTQIKRF